VLFDKFKAKAEAVSAEVHRLPTWDAALDFITSFLQGEGIADAPHSRAVWAGCPLADGAERRLFSEKAPGLTFEVTREAAAEAKIGITSMEWALADTGTLAQTSTSVEQMLASSLPVIHMAMLETGSILPDMSSLLTQKNPGESGYLSMITGPSRTADIERVLTIGVHGPERLVIVFVDEPGGLDR
jgi:L-lactate dehydrogenase complex protein LldG